jgi:hypothetical protein
MRPFWPTLARTAPVAWNSLGCPWVLHDGLVHADRMHVDVVLAILVPRDLARGEIDRDRHRRIDRDALRHTVSLEHVGLHPPVGVLHREIDVADRSPGRHETLAREARDQLRLRRRPGEACVAVEHAGEARQPGEARERTDIGLLHVELHEVVGLLAPARLPAQRRDLDGDVDSRLDVLRGGSTHAQRGLQSLVAERSVEPRIADRLAVDREVVRDEPELRLRATGVDSGDEVGVDRAGELQPGLQLLDDGQP